MTNKKSADIINQYTKQSWVYSETVKKHFFHPRNFLIEDPKKDDFNGLGTVGSPACGDVMRIWLKVDPKTDRIKKFKWRTFGCASAIASTSMLSVMVTEKGGMKVDQALKLTAKDILDRLGGLPDRKIHCSVLGDKGLIAALNDYFKNTEQFDRIIVEGTKIIDPATKTTEADIEEAVLEGARTIKDIQKKTKAGIDSEEVRQQIEQLIRYYVEKHFANE